MPTFAGRILLADHAPEGWITVEDGRVQDWGEGEPDAPVTATGWILPPPVNAHTHVGDAFLRSIPDKPTDVAALVGPGGWKHQQLARADPDQMAVGIQQYVDEMAGLGTSHFIDFREGGLPGVRFIEERVDHLAVDPIILGRPARPGTFDEDEAEAIVGECDGIGMSGMRDHPPRVLEAWAEAAHAARKPFAIHVSEDKQDDIDAVLALEPAFVVHMVHATRGDLQAVADAGIPVVVCPRSNRFFGTKTPLPRLLEAGCRVAVGTDNGMLQDGNLLEELALLRAWYPEGATDEALLRMLVAGRRLVGLETAPAPRRNAAAEWVVYPERPIPQTDGGRPTLRPTTVPSEAHAGDAFHDTPATGKDTVGDREP